MTTALGVLIIAAAVYAIVRRVDVRLALLLAAVALGAVAGDLPSIVSTFFATLSNEQFVVPICCAMGFAYVLRHTGCDQHLVRLLVEPLKKVRGLLIPGAVLVGFLVNLPIISQTSTAVTIGAVLVPLLRAANVSPVTTGAALLLGSSLGGELLNPGAPELRTLSKTLDVNATECVARMVPLLFLQLGVATVVFWVLSTWAERAYRDRLEKSPAGEAGAPVVPQEFRVNFFKALVPLVPLALLFLTAVPRFQVIAVPENWLIEAKGPADSHTYNTRLIGAAMLVGTIVAALTSWRTAGATARVFFDGAGYALTHIVSLIVIANCFGKGVQRIGFDALVGALIERWPESLLPTAGTMPLAFAALCGSGFASTQSLFGFFVEPARALGVDPAHVGAVVSISSAAGRTMSPVAAVTLMCASLTETSPLEVARRVAPPLLVGVVCVVVAAILMARP